jgi:2-amino-4-hydroxy-6-hydroxymethyldihydropteridine diphosphokinase
MDAWIGLGSNLGGRFKNLRRAVEAMTGIGSVRALSAVYETAAELTVSASASSSDSPAPSLAPDAARPYLNAALWLETGLPPHDLINSLLAVEAHAGRVRVPGQPDAPRPLDLDVLLLGRHGDVVLVSDELTVPHPRLHLRAFALRPLLDLAPALIHPALSLPLRVLYHLLPVDPQPPRPLGWL